MTANPNPNGPLRCRRCGAELSPGARFCASCGKEQIAQAPTVLASQIAPTQAASPQNAMTELAEPAPRGSYTPLPPMRLLPGTVLAGVYAVEAVLGEGGMGVVYRARDLSRDRIVAVKCLHTNLSGDAEVRRRFVREAKVLRSFTHPNVVATFDLIEHEHLLAIVMEHVDGLTLVQHIEKWRGRMPLEEVAAIFYGVLEAMENAHKQGIVHRDLKPDNILVGRAGARMVPKVVDFGIAKILEGTTYTVTGAFLGTCRYMSPEQVQRPELSDHRSDIYSLGVTLYQLITGRVPFDDGNHFALMMAHVSQKPPPPSAHRQGLPDALERLILDALAKDPAARPQTCAEFQERLHAAIGDLGSPSSLRSAGSDAPLPPILHDTDGCELVLVPEGPFAMGPNRREVHLDAFYIDRTPVTNLQFRTFLEVTGYRPEDQGSTRFLAHWARGSIPRGLEHHPVVFVSWLDARAYATWAGKRLPTEAEWEKAARGTDGRKYPWGKGEPTPTRANFGGRHKSTLPVGSFPEGVSPYGVLDLAGNVWEWCEDVDDPAFYTDGPSHNPKSTRKPERSFYVMRGGSWMYGAQALRTTSRTSFEPHYRFAAGGFRCVRPVR
jgi:serine/threonine-protein kinase